MRAVVLRLQKLASDRNGVLLSGESASGRRMIAREIHAADRRAGAPFVEVTCSRKLAADVKQALFGTCCDETATTTDTSASLSQATHAHAPGRESHVAVETISEHSLLHAAQGGTLFLADVTDLSTRVQGKLARILRDGEVRLLESGMTKTLDVRVIASCGPAVEEAIADGSLRMDLYRHLAVHRVAIPPLRDRREDLPLIANTLLQQACASCHLEPKAIERPALALMSALPWRGNVDELRSVIQDLAVSSPVDGVRLEDVLAIVSFDGITRSGTTAAPLRDARAVFERDYITETLELHHGKVSAAARALGVSRANLYRKVRALGLDTAIGAATERLAAQDSRAKAATRTPNAASTSKPGRAVRDEDEAASTPVAPPAVLPQAAKWEISTSRAPLALAVDDEEDVRELLAIYLNEMAFDVVTAADGFEALAMCARQRFELIVVDLSMPKMTGLEFIERAREANHDAVILLVTGFATTETGAEAVRRGANGLLTKPFSVDALHHHVRLAFEDRYNKRHQGDTSERTGTAGRSRGDILQ